MNAKHTSNTQEWYTPKAYLDAAKEVMGHIDLDPASSAIANSSVEATTYYTLEQDGLSKPWGHLDNTVKVFCNPPGGKLKGKSIPKMFWEKLIVEAELGYIAEAIFLAFSIELLQTSQLSYVTPAASHPICIPNRRIAFVDATGKPVKGNTHASAIIYVPGTVDNSQKFCEVFKKFGSIVLPYN